MRMIIKWTQENMTSSRYNVIEYIYIYIYIKEFDYVSYSLGRSPGGGEVWRELPPSGTGRCCGGPGGGLQARSPVPCALVSPHRRGRGKRGGGNLKRTGQAPLLIRRGGGLRCIPTGGGSR